MIEYHDLCVQVMCLPVGPQVRDGAMNCLVEIYRHVGERVRIDLGKKGLPQSRCVQSSL